MRGDCAPREPAQVPQRCRHRIRELQMTGAEQSQRRGVVEVAQAIQAHGVEALQGQSLAVGEVSETSMGSMSLSSTIARDESLGQFHARVELAEHALHCAQRRGRRAGVVEQRLALRFAEARVVAIDRDLLSRDEEAIPLQHQRVRNRRAHRRCRRGSRRA